MGCVYLHKNKITNDSYIGCSVCDYQLIEFGVKLFMWAL